MLSALPMRSASVAIRFVSLPVCAALDGPARSTCMRTIAVWYHWARGRARGGYSHGQYSRGKYSCGKYSHGKYSHGKYSRGQCTDARKTAMTRSVRALLEARHEWK